MEVGHGTLPRHLRTPKRGVQPTQKGFLGDSARVDSGPSLGLTPSKDGDI